MTRSRVNAKTKRRKMNEDGLDKVKTRGIEEHMNGELLPGIPNKIVLHVICTKLPWIAFYALSLVSRAWKRAVENYKVFHARVDVGAVEPLAIINHTVSRDINGIALYSFRANAYYYLPPIPHIACGIPRSCECITLDGKIYVLGGLKSHSLPNIISNEVYMFDLAGQKRWEACENMLVPRYRFGCATLKGKIYVFGGISLGNHVCRSSEVYDPKIDAWTGSTPLTSARSCHQAETVGDELLICGGKFRDGKVSNSVEFYNPLNHKWRKVLEGHTRRLMRTQGWSMSSPSDRFTRVFEAKGHLYIITRDSIVVVDTENDTSQQVHSYTYTAEQARLVPFFGPYIREVLAVDDQLLARCKGWREGNVYTGLLESRGFGIRGRAIVWQTGQCSLCFDSSILPHPLMCPIWL